MCEIYPTLLRLSKESELIEKPLPFEGPVRPFTIFQDLEKGRVEVTGRAQNGPFRFYLAAEKGKLKLIALKGPLKSLILAGAQETLPPKEQLSLGINKQQDWQMVCRRSDPAEILPFWARLAAWTPEVPHDPSEKRGTYGLLKEGEKAEQYALVQNAFEGCFEGILVPRLHDGHLGLISPEPLPNDLSSLPLLHLGAKLIRGLFVRFEDDQIALLPHLPPQFHAGRLIHSFTPAGDLLSIEWSKKLLKKVHLKAGSTRAIHLKLQRPLQSYRLRVGRAKRGERHSVKEPLQIESGRDYFLDRFEK